MKGLDFGPRYESTITETSGNEYTVLSDSWGEEIIMPDLDEIAIDCSLAAGNEAQLRFGTSSGQYGRPLPVKVGNTVWSDRKKLSKGLIDRVQFRNAAAGANAEIIAEVWGA